MKITISKKLIVSYIILLITAFSIAILITSSVVSLRLRAKAKNDLEIQADAILIFLENVRFDISDPRRLVTYMRQSNVGGLVTSELILTDPKGQLIYTTSDAITANNVRQLLNERPRVEYIFARRLLDAEGLAIGTLTLITPISYIDQYNRTIRLSLLIGFAIAFLIAIPITLFMKRLVVTPLKRLSNQISAAAADASIIIEPIVSKDEIGDLYRSFQNMQETIDHNMEAKKRFYQNASHELKTPLTSIQGYAEGILDGVIEGEDVEASLQIIINKSKQLRKTVDESMYLSKIMSEDVVYQMMNLDLVPVLRGLVEDYQYLAREKGLVITLVTSHPSIRLYGDSDKLESCIGNLLSNALRYAKSEVRIEAHAMEEEIALRIIDDGKGLEPGEASKVFERFYKGDGGHTGIGLAIVYEIIKAHDATIKAYNGMVAGAIFDIRFKHKE